MYGLLPALSRYRRALTGESAPGAGGSAGRERDEAAVGAQAERAPLAHHLEVGALRDAGQVGLRALDFSKRERVLDPDDPRLLGRDHADAGKSVRHRPPGGGSLFLRAAVGGIGLAVLFNQSRLIEYSLYPYAIILQVTPIVAIAP